MTPTPRAILDERLPIGGIGPVMLLGVCPLLAASDTAVKAVGIGFATVVALTLTNVLAWLLRRATGDEVRLPALLLIVAALVGTIDLVLRAWLPGLHAVLGPCIPLVAVTCVLLGRTDADAQDRGMVPVAFDGLAAGSRVLSMLLAIGALREFAGAGTLFAGAGATLHLPALEVSFAAAPRFLLATLPAGAFLAFAVLVAAQQRRRATPSPAHAPPSHEPPPR